jgi:hypothetical protein
MSLVGGADSFIGRESDVSPVNTSTCRSIPTRVAAIRTATVRVAVAVVVAGIGASLGAAPATADQYLRVGGSWDIIQSNGYRVNVNLTQDGPNVSGSARTLDNKLSSGGVTGTVDGSSIHLLIPWTPNSEGKYDGSWTANTVGDGSGYLKGTTCDQHHLEVCASWSSEGITFYR